MSRFKNLKDKIFEIEIGGDKVKVKPKVKNVEMFMLMKKDMNEKQVENISNIIVDTVKSANPDEDIEDIKADVATHYIEYVEGLSILFGFTTREKLELEKKKIENEQKKLESQ